MMRYATVLSVAAALGLPSCDAYVAPTAALGQGSFVGAQRTASRWVSSPSQRVGAGSWSMQSTADFKNGMTIDIDGNPCKILEFLHVKPGKGSAFVRTKVKNLISGNTLEKTFRAGEPISFAQVDKKELQYTYTEKDMYYFMDTQSFEEVSIEMKVVGDKADFFKEGMALEALFFDGRTIDVMIPKQMVIEVAETDPGEKGNTAQGGSKPAKLETGATVNVPLFIQVGEKIRVDTESRKYMARANE